MSSQRKSWEKPSYTVLINVADSANLTASMVADGGYDNVTMTLLTSPMGS